jgi:type IV pilus assembly protein PilB
MIPLEVIQEVSAQMAWSYQVVPFRSEGGKLWFYALSASASTQDELTLLLGKEATLEETEKENLQQMLATYYRRDEAGYGTATIAFTSKEKDFLSGIIAEARQVRSSDIHIETYEKRCRIRYRIDGKLIERYAVDQQEYPALVNKIKIRANLDISEKRLPQDGRIFFEAQGMKFDIRVSSLPTLHGEKIVMRLLSTGEMKIGLVELGFQAVEMEAYVEGIGKPNGMVLISGPTGSGKTTTLYATLQMLNKTDYNIVTIEDPIEYTLEGINQVQLREAIGLDFTSALRTFLRQDPDIIMVGEIRDVNTASMAIRASLTGHLVLSTIHTNSAWGIVSRLVDMGIPSYLLADTLNTAVAQRLVRLLCPHCKQKAVPKTTDFPRNYRKETLPITIWKATGCDQCYYTGYKGRKAIYEVVTIDGHLSDKIKAHELNVKAYLQEKNIKSLADNAYAILLEGSTSLEEIYPILSSSN